MSRMAYSKRKKITRSLEPASEVHGNLQRKAFPHAANGNRLGNNRGSEFPRSTQTCMLVTQRIDKHGLAVSWQTDHFRPSASAVVSTAGMCQNSLTFHLRILHGQSPLNSCSGIVQSTMLRRCACIQGLQRSEEHPREESYTRLCCPMLGSRFLVF